MRNLFSIVNKNMKVIYRSKISFLLMILSPILIVFLVGSAFSSNSLNDIYLGVYSESQSDLSQNITAGLEEEGFKIIEFESLENCISSVREGISHVCINYPENLSILGNSDYVEVYVDNSRINIAYTLIDIIKSKISLEASRIGVAMADELLENLEAAKSKLPEVKDNVEEAKAKINVVNSKSKELVEGPGGTTIKEAISKIDESILLVEGLETEDSVSSITSKLEEIKKSLSENNEEISLELEEIRSNGDQGSEKIELARKDIDELIEKISSSKVNNSENVVNPIKTKINELNLDSTNWKNLFPTLIALILLLSSVVLSSSLVLGERKSRANFRNFMTPTSDFTFLIGTYITSLIIIFIQMLVLFGGAYYFTKVNVFSLEILLIFILSTSLFIFLGMWIGYLFKSDETTILAGISVSSILIFFSNIIIPSELIGGTLKVISDYNPLLITDFLLRKSILFNQEINILGLEVLVLVIGIVLFLFLSVLSREISKRFV